MDIKLSRKIVFGSWPISGDFSKKKRANSKKLVKYAISRGIKEFDTAPNYGYGKSEEILGEVISKLKKKPKINTKIGNNHNKEKNFDIYTLKETFHKSLKLLNVKKVNVLFLHNPLNIKNINEIIIFLKKLKKKNLINNFGLSISKDFKYKKSFIDNFKIIQLDYNLIFIKNKFDIKFKNKFIYARSPFASGALAFNINKKKLATKDLRSIWLKSKRKTIIKKQIKYLEKLHNKKIYKLAIDFILKDSFCNKIIFGFSSIFQFRIFLKEIDELNRKNIWKDHYKIFKKNKIFKLKGF